MIRWRPGALLRGSFVVFGWSSVRIGLQLLWVVLVARNLGLEAYGSYGGISGLAIGLSGFSGVGLGLRMYRDVVNDPALLGVRWAQATRALQLSACVLAASFVLIARLVFPEVSVGLLVAIAISELFLVPAVQQVSFSYAASHRLSRASAGHVLMSAARVMAIGLLPWCPWGHDLQTYGVLHLLLTGATAVLVWQGCLRELKPGRAPGSVTLSEFRDGLSFTSVWASSLALSSVDKTAAMRLGGNEVAGQYTAAYRVAVVAAMPVEALAAAALPRLFRTDHGIDRRRRLLLALVFATTAYSALAGSTLFMGADFLPLLLGPAFEPAVAPLRVLALFVAATGFRGVGGQVLLGFGKRRFRATTEVGALILAVILMAWWIPGAGATGAAEALLTSEAVLASLFWSRIVVEIRNAA